MVSWPLLNLRNFCNIKSLQRFNKVAPLTISNFFCPCHTSILLFNMDNDCTHANNTTNKYSNMSNILLVAIYLLSHTYNDGLIINGTYSLF